MKAWAPIVMVIGLIGIVALAIALASRGPGPVRPEQLADLIDKADKVVVVEQPTEQSEGGILYESSDRRDLNALKASLRLERPDKRFFCGCGGNPAVVLYAKGEEIGGFTNHHLTSIRCRLWNSDARLIDGTALLKWFDDRGITGPRKEHERALRDPAEFRLVAARWLAGLPASLRPHWDHMRLVLVPDIRMLRAALAEEMPDQNKRILALFRWFGSGEGSWSRIATYEMVPEKLLRDYSTADLLAAIKGQDLTEEHVEGVARLFARQAPSRARAIGDQRLPADLKTRFLKHCLASDDREKRVLGERAFGAK